MFKSKSDCTGLKTSLSPDTLNFLCSYTSHWSNWEVPCMSIPNFKLMQVRIAKLQRNSSLLSEKSVWLHRHLHQLVVNKVLLHPRFVCTANAFEFSRHSITICAIFISASVFHVDLCMSDCLHQMKKSCMWACLCIYIRKQGSYPFYFTRYWLMFLNILQTYILVEKKIMYWSHL